MVDLDPIPYETAEFGDFYDELPLWSAPFGLWILDRAPMRSGQTILDVGSGTGFLAIEMAERCGDSSTVIAVDPWETAMDRLRRKAAYRGIRNIRYLQQDAVSLELPDASVDVLVSNLGINNFNDPNQVMAICSRAAKPGASLLLTTNLVGHMAEFYDVLRHVLKDVGKQDRIEALDAHIHHRATIESIIGLVESAQFAVNEMATDAFRLRFANGSSLLRHNFIRLGFLPAWVDVVGSRDRDETFTALEQALNERAQRDGELSLTIPMACVMARKQ